MIFFKKSTLPGPQKLNRFGHLTIDLILNKNGLFEAANFASGWRSEDRIRLFGCGREIFEAEA